MADSPTPAEITVTVRYFAAARAAAGVPEETLTVLAVGTSTGTGPAADVSGPQTASVGTVLQAATDRHGSRLATVLRRCSFLLDEVSVHGTDTRVQAGQVLDVLPPFAGG